MQTLASILEMIPGLALIGLFYLVPTVVIIATWWTIQKERPLPVYEMAFIAIVPYLVWSALTIIDGSGKTMANALVEPMILAGILAAVSCLRILIKDNRYATVAVPILYGAVLCCAFLLWLLMPGLPE
jgi:predicted neutral ceramidase superfamily lipid hydrolase